MVLTECVDLDTADDEQLDLFYLVDCVLDEIELAKQAAAQGADSTTDTMPEATEEFYTPDLMDHFESTSHYSDSEQSYSSPDTSSYMTNRSFQTTPDLYSSLPPELAVELIQSDIESECYSNFIRRDASSDMSMTSASAQNEFVHKEPYTASQDDCSSHGNYKFPSFIEYEQNQDRIYNCDSQKDSILKTSDLQLDRNTYTFSRDFPTEFADLKHYTDILQSRDLVQGSQVPLATSRSPVSQSMAPSSSEHFYSEDSNDTTATEFVSWTCKHPENWSATEVLDWLYYSAERNGIDCSLLRGESFRTVTGAILCEMGPDGFSQLEPKYGPFLYKLFRQLVNGLRFTLAPDAQVSFEDQSDQDIYYPDPHAPVYYQPGQTAHDDREHRLQFNTKSVYPIQTSTDIYCQEQQPKETYAYDYGTQSTSTPCHANVEPDLTGYGYGREPQGPQYEPLYRCDYTVNPCNMSSRDQFRPTQSKVASIRAKYEDGITPRRRPGRPRIKSLPTEEELAAQREKKLKSQHLWEFIYELLNKPTYNPSVLKWENQSEGTFRFIQSETVAQLWGTLKSNENMTYEKLSRAMRHYYKRGILERVEGRRLVYKFSRVTLEKMKEKMAAKAALQH